MTITFTDEEIQFMNRTLDREYCGEDADCKKCFINKFYNFFECFDIIEAFIVLYKENGYNKTIEIK